MLILRLFKKTKKIKRDKKSYIESLIISWLHLIVYLAIGLYVYYFYDVSLTYKIIILFFLSIFTPDGADCVRSYSTYLRDIEEEKKMFPK